MTEALASSRPARSIHVLDDHIANKIAAGEVIERPASVVKELIENALDAGSRRIEVELKAGGKEYIRVTDDGTGIEPEQMATAFARHATSKIRAAEDLFAVDTLGFRGEALPSIAAVAEVELRSRRPGNPGGFRLEAEGGVLGPVEPVGMPPGTSIVVRKLFFNTPARYKFLRSDGAERRRIADVVARNALAWPQVAWRLVADGRELLSTPGDGRMDSVLRGLYGNSTADALVPVDFEQDGMEVTGFVSKPDTVHGNRDRMSIFLNRRWIQSSSLLHAIQRGYETLLPSRRFPVAVIHLKVDPRAVDVNVHPAKSEVRFQDDGAVYRTVMRAVRYALLEANLIGGLSPGTLTSVPPFPESPGAKRSDAGSRPCGEGVREGITPAPSEQSSYGPSETAPSWPEQRRFPDVADETRQPSGYDGPSSTTPHGKSHAGVSKNRPHGKTLHAAMYEEAWRATAGHTATHLSSGGDVSADGATRTLLREMTVLGQLQRTFILGETGVGLWIVDQHVAHERVLYERYLVEGAQADGVQRLLVPIVITLSPERIGLVEQFHDELTRLGFDLEAFGVNAYAVRGVPVALAKVRDEGRLTALLEDILDACVTEGRWDDHDAAAALACKAAVKAGDSLTQEQMKQLLLQLSEADNPFACPHGRPIVVEVGRLDLERRFGRR